MINFRLVCDWALHPLYSDILVSDSGIIMSYKRGSWTELKQSDNDSGYLRVGVGHSNPQYVHRLVAETFLPNPQLLPEVDHVDDDKYNNYVSNLEWVTTSENNLRAFRTGIKQVSGRPVQIVETGQRFESISECARQIGGIQGNVSLCLAGSRHSHRGFTFAYVDGDNNE